MQKDTYLWVTFFLIFLLSTALRRASSQTAADDAAAMLALKQTLTPPESLGWSDADPCKWTHVGCSGSGRVTRIQIGRQSLRGTLPPSLRNLTELERLELQFNQISGPLPTLRGLSSLQVLLLNGNLFTSIPADFFSGMKSLASFEIDGNPFHAWQIPESLQDAAALQNFSANSVNITGKIPEFFSAAVFPSLSLLHLAMNNLQGGLPETLAGSQIQSLWVNGLSTSGKLTGSIDVISKMTSLREVWLHSNALSGPLPDLSGLTDLQVLSLRDNLFTGPVPLSLLKLESLSVLNLTNNLLQGPTPKFKNSVSVDLSPNTNSFCSSSPGDCDRRVNTLLSIAKSMGYPQKFAQNWKGNDPCAGSGWMGIICNRGNITVVNFQKMGLNGTISPDFAQLKSVRRLVLADNNLTGTIPVELTTLTALTVLDVSNNRIHGKIPPFNSNVMVVTRGNPEIGDERSLKIPPLGSPPKTTPTPTPTPTPTSSSQSPNSDKSGRSKMKPSIWFVIIVCSIGFLLLIGLLFGGVFHYMKKQKQLARVQSPNAMVIHPRRSSSDNDSLKITVAGSSVTVGGVTETPGNETQMVELEAGNMVISIHVLKNVTNNFDQKNILGQGGFGTVYKGELHDGTKIAVKRMECGVITGKGHTEFRSEIAVLTKVRHRHLVALLGYCLDGNEKLLVYEYMPEGTLSRHLFNWVEEGLQPLEWTRRLSIALDVARGVEYLHGLAHQSFIHRDLKPSNILLGDDLRAKVADFGLVRLAPDGKGSIETRIAGTFGYLAPEYAVTGRVTTKADVFSFGVILMELITGRKALDESQPEESMHLVTWFKKMHVNKDTFKKSIDPSIQLNDVTFASISTVAELAGHCCAREPYQRPDMCHAVNVLSSLVELWKPTDPNPDDIYGIDLEMSLPQALKKWQAYEGSSYGDSSSSLLVPSSDNSQTSLPTRPYGFADSFTSQDGR